MEAMAMKVYSKFPKGPALLEPHHQFGLLWFYGTSTIVDEKCQIHFRAHKQFYFKQFSLAYKTVLFQTIQFCICTYFTTLGQSGPGSDVNERLLHIPQSSTIIGATPSDFLVSYPGHCREAISVLDSLSWRA